MHFIQAKTILSAQNGMNLYRGCTHGCIYCDSRSLCYGMEHDFADVAVKENAVELLADALKRKRKRCMIATGSMSDPYMPLEQELCMTRRAAELVYRGGFGFTVITKSDLVLRDLPLLTEINRQSKCVVQMTLTNCDDRLSRILEPNVCTTTRRFEVLLALRDAGIPTVVWMTPFLPFINDTRKNIEGLLAMCVEAKVRGIVCFGIGMTLRAGNREYYYQQLNRHFPGMQEQYVRRFGDSYSVNSPNHIMLMRLIQETCEQHGILYDPDAIFHYLAEFEEPEMQLTLI